MFGVAFYQRLDECSFSNLRTMSGCAGGFNAETYPGGSHDGDNNWGCLLR